MINHYNRTKDNIYILSKNSINFEAEAVLKQYCEECLREAMPTPIEVLIEKMGLTLKYNKLSPDLSILGACIFNKGMVEIYDNGKKEIIELKDRTIVIDSKLADNDDSRLTFTYGHELGHYITQYDLIHINENQLSLFNESTEKQVASICKRESFEDTWFLKGPKELKTKEDWMEWQANCFASAILIPKSTLDKELKPLFDKFQLSHEEYLFDMLDGQDIFDYVQSLARKYDVTLPVMINRLKSLGYMKGGR